ncbi:MAG: hypothetical protein AAF353_12955 [Pseudomonadota bacterium]
MKSIIVAGFMMLVSGLSSACGLEDAQVIRVDPELEIYYRTDATPISVAEHFVLQLQICQGGRAAPVQQFKLDANMPMHGHGMNYRPDIVQLKDGAYRVAGLMFHMSGNWRVEMSFKLQGDSYKTHFDYLL